MKLCSCNANILKGPHKLLEYHYANGGISRYDKMNWFYEQVLGGKVDPDP